MSERVGRRPHPRRRSRLREGARGAATVPAAPARRQSLCRRLRSRQGAASVPCRRVDAARPLLPGRSRTCKTLGEKKTSSAGRGTLQRKRTAEKVPRKSSKKVLGLARSSPRGCLRVLKSWSKKSSSDASCRWRSPLPAGGCSSVQKEKVS